MQTAKKVICEIGSLFNSLNFLFQYVTELETRQLLLYGHKEKIDQALNYKTFGVMPQKGCG